MSMNNDEIGDADVLDVCRALHKFEERSGFNSTKLLLFIVFGRVLKCSLLEIPIGQVVERSIRPSSFKGWFAGGTFLTDLYVRINLILYLSPGIFRLKRVLYTTFTQTSYRPMKEQFKRRVGEEVGTAFCTALMIFVVRTKELLLSDANVDPYSPIVDDTWRQ